MILFKETYSRKTFLSIETPCLNALSPVLWTKMKVSPLKPIAFFCFLILSAPGIRSLDRDFLVGLNADVAPFGLESLIPGGSVSLWAFEEGPLSPGVDLQLYAWTDRQEISSHLYLRLGNAPVAPFAGGGWIYLRGEYFGHKLADWYPELIGGLRIAIPRWPVLCPILSIRIKENDTDKNLIGLGGIGF